MENPRTVLLATNDPALLQSLTAFFKRLHWRVLAASDGRSAIEVATQHSPDVAVIEMLLPIQSGFQVTRELKERLEMRVHVMMISEYCAVPHRAYARAVGVDGFLSKPLSPAVLLETLSGHGFSGQVALTDPVRISQPSAIPA